MESRSKLNNLLKQKYPKNIYIQIYSLLKDHKHTINDNGIFFNLSDVSDENIEKCVKFIETIDSNIEDHMKNLTIREDIENQYKTDIFSKENLQISTKSPLKTSKKIKEESDFPIIPKKVYKGVYNRLDRLLRGLKPEEDKIKKKSIVAEEITQEDEVDDEIIEDDEDLFGHDSDLDEDSKIDSGDEKDM